MAHSLHLLDSYLPGTETFIWQTLRHLRRYPPVILADRRENPENFPLPGAEFLALTPKRSLTTLVAARLSGDFASVHYPGGKEALQARDIAVCHAHKGFRALVTREFTASLGKPLIVTFYGSDISQQSVLNRAGSGYAQLFTQAKFLLVEGPAMKQRLLGLGAPDEKIRIQRIGIPVSEYPFRERNGEGKRPVQILFIGRMVEKKGLAIGLRALADARIKFPWRLTAVGGGPLWEELKSQAGRLGILNRIDFPGYLPREKSLSLMNTHDLLLQPSLTAEDGDSEGGAPTVILEAQACGMPVISTTHADIPYITASENKMWLSPEGDAENLSANLIQAVEEHSRWGAMGRAGRAKVEADHDAVKETGKLENLYAEVAG